MKPVPSIPRAWRQRPLLALALASVAALIVVVTGVTATDHHVRTSAGFCASCHGDVRSHSAPHRGVACQTCHVAHVGDRLALAAARLTGSRPKRGHGTVAPASCATCHRAGSDHAAFATTPGHRAHVNGAQRVDCVRCHAGSLHDRPSPTESCASCHASVPLQSEPRDQGSCVRCHEFTTARADVAAAVRAGVAGSSPHIDASRVHGSVDCRQCHNPHRPVTDASVPSGTDCARCHRGHIQDEVAAGPDGHRACLGCHQVHADRREAGIRCDGCHVAPHRTAPPGSPASGARMNGAAPGVRTATTTRARTNEALALPSAVRAWMTIEGARPPSLSASAPSIPANPAHATWTHGGQCSSCHRPHTWTAQTTDCRGCHATQAASIAPGTPHGRNDCTSCHDPHGNAPTAGTCTSCHAVEAQRAQRPAVAAQHRDCLSCHRPHDTAAPTSATCAQCHRNERDRVAHGPAAHTNCASCHAVHGPPAANATACAGCHAVEAAWFATAVVPAQHRRCDSCHADHEFSRPAARASCTTCHAEVATHRGSHMGECVSCHSPHAPVPSIDTNSCTSCHTAAHAAGPPAMRAGHANCAGCHQPHQAAAPAASACVTCHRTEARAALSWPAASPHGDDCTACHSPHDDRAPPADNCVRCHATEATVAHRGNHAQCTQCHAPHRERPAGGGSAWWTRCADCHREQRAATMAPTTTTTHQQCANCHQRPGLQAPTCVSCHSTIPSSFLHAVPQHATCISCHATHGNAPPSRAQCVACHADRVNHFADAPTCQSCHPFGAPGGPVH